MRKSVSKYILFMAMLVMCTVFIFTPINSYADIDSTIRNTVKSTYAQALVLGKRRVSTLYSDRFQDSNYTYCGLCVGCNLQAAGVFSTYQGSDGNKTYDKMVNGTPTSGFVKTIYPGPNKGGSYTITQICNIINARNTNGHMTYVVFGFNKGSSSSGGQAYGHAVVVHCIYGGNVYWTEWNSNLNVGSISDFANRYKQSGSTYVFDGAVSFIKPADEEEITTLEFRDVVYPKTYKINSGGWYLGGGLLLSDQPLQSIEAKILKADGTVISSMSSPMSISGNVFSITGLDGTGASDNGQKFSKITSPGEYIWRLTAIDSSGRPLTLNMNFTAVSSGSTETAKSSIKYGETIPSTYAFEFKDIVYPSTFKINRTQGWTLSGGILTCDNELRTITTKIVNSNGTIISGPKTHNISGHTYTIKNLDTYYTSGDTSDNGVKFSKITTAGVYKWIITAIDSEGRELPIEMTFNAVSSGSTVTSTASSGQYICPHSNTTIFTVVEPTCLAEGLEETRCNQCGEVLSSSVIPATGHSWGEWTVTVNPTCTSAGVETRICNNDSSHQETRSIAAIGHSWGEWTVTVNPTCTNTGVETRVCNNDSSHQETRTIAALGHLPGPWIVVSEPVADIPGLKEQRCTRCNEL